MSQNDIRAARKLIIDLIRAEGHLSEDIIDEIEFELEYATEPGLREIIAEGDAISFEDCVKLEDLEWWNKS